MHNCIKFISPKYDIKYSPNDDMFWLWQIYGITPKKQNKDVTTETPPNVFKHLKTI